MLAQEIIRKKRQGQVLSPQEIESFVQGITCEEVDEAQMAAFAMAVFLKGMNIAETAKLTAAMRDSGETLDWDLPGPVLDKHSTGGVGDMVSLILGPIVAACGGYVPMISGRGLGHSGGTVVHLDCAEADRVVAWAFERAAGVLTWALALTGLLQVRGAVPAELGALGRPPLLRPLPRWLRHRKRWRRARLGEGRSSVSCMWDVAHTATRWGRAGSRVRWRPRAAADASNSSTVRVSPAAWCQSLRRPVLEEQVRWS